MPVSILDLLWLFLMISARQPILQRRLLESARRPSVQYIPLPYRGSEPARPAPGR